jgi:hypothetical protein
MTAARRIIRAIAVHHAPAAVRIHDVQHYGDRWVAFDRDDRVVATGSLIGRTVTIMRVHS